MSQPVVQNILKEFYGLELVDSMKLPGYDDFSAMVTYHTMDQQHLNKAVLKVLGYDNSSKTDLQTFLGMWHMYCKYHGPRSEFQVWGPPLPSVHKL